MIQEAIESCPVDCIHAVTNAELRQLEEERESDVINNKSRLVGGSYTSEEKGGDASCPMSSRMRNDARSTSCGTHALKALYGSYADRTFTRP